MSTAIRFDHVSKRFVLHHQRPRSFQELAIQLFKRNGEALEKHLGTTAAVDSRGREEFWALRDVSFRVEKGETLGIIGPNGAGKSTVLKLISRIIEPTSGEMEVNGRVGALLELGAGFHHDLSGRENIYLNGSILGLGRGEIDRKLDEIIAFTELERFIDMPVKHYSSGMRMRLGFSIAAHMDPEILLVDEILAVGDQNFQHKCIEHIIEMQRQGVTICFVSHGLASVRRLCSRAIWLSDGGVQVDGEVEDVVSAYLRQAADEEDSRLVEASLVRRIGASDELDIGAPADSVDAVQMKILGVAFLDAGGRERQVFRMGEPWIVRVRYRVRERIQNPVFRFTIKRNDGLQVCGSSIDSDGLNLPWLEGEGEVLYTVSSVPLVDGMYLLSVSVHDQGDTVTLDRLDQPRAFRVRQVGVGEKYGLISLGGEWEWRAEQSSLATESSWEGKKVDRKPGGKVAAERRWGTQEMAIADVAFLDAAGVKRRVFETGEPWVARLRYRAPRRIENPVFGLAIHREGNLHVCGPNTYFAGLDIPFVEGEGCVYYRVDELLLTAGTYYVSVSAHNLADTVMYDYKDRLHVFKVCQFTDGEEVGVVSLSGEWKWNDGGEDDFA